MGFFLQERFVDLFGGASEYLGETLFLYFFKNESFTQSTFIAAMETMKEGIVDNRDLVTFLWHIFPMQEQVRSPGQNIPSQILLIYISISHY